ncbi:MAG: hypothetical protein HKN80_03525 [Acidimicrobiia bacterium]|nr:hypothetical protein [Acidimicrobiia bacterium]
MIPTVFVIGALFRRWWAIVAAAVLWPVAVVVWGDVDNLGDFLAAGLLGAVNAAIGALIGSAIWNVVRGLTKSLHTRPPDEARQ